MASIYDNNSNCLECGRLVAPSSGITGANPSNLFCCRKCLRSYYDDQPGLWEQEEEEESIRQEFEFQRQSDEEYQRILQEESIVTHEKNLSYHKFYRLPLYLTLCFFIFLFLRSCSL